jgi:L-ascorbate metabolism protein UlaG (beta-lactamase superfamily)
MNPNDALKAMEMLRAKRMVSIHWGAFRLSLEPVDEPPPKIPETSGRRKNQSPRRSLTAGRKNKILTPRKKSSANGGLPALRGIAL